MFMGVPLYGSYTTTYNDETGEMEADPSVVPTAIAFSALGLAIGAAAMVVKHFVSSNSNQAKNAVSQQENLALQEVSEKMQSL